MQNTTQVNMAIFKKDSPTKEEVMLWENKPELIPAIQAELARHYLEFTENEECLYNEKSYYALCRALSLAQHYKIEIFFKEALEIYLELAQSDDEIMEGIVSSFLNEFIEKDHEDYLLKVWRGLSEEIHEAEFFVISLLLKIKCKDQAFIKTIKEIYHDDPEWLSYYIIQAIDDLSFQNEILTRMQYIAPMVKYLENDREKNVYYHEMIEDGIAWLDKNCSDKLLDPLNQTSSKKNFFNKIMGFTSEQSSTILLEGLTQSLKDTSDDQFILDYHKKSNVLFEKYFFKNLPPTMNEWLNSPFILHEQRDEFIEFKLDLEEKEAEIIFHECKIGRNDPCPCGSLFKYKKCCLVKVQ